MSKLLDLTRHDLTPLDPSAIVIDPDWHDLTAYIIQDPVPALAFETRNGWRAGIHINPSATVYSYRKYNTVEAANEAAQKKLDELTKGKGQ